MGGQKTDSVMHACAMLSNFKKSVVGKAPTV